MDELLGGIFALIAEVAFEAVFEIVVLGLASLLLRAISKLFKSISHGNVVATTIVLGILGASAGFLSVAAYPHPFVHPSRFHGISVIASPLITGLVMSQLGRFLSNRGKRVTPVESFGYGFAFAFAMALVRFLMLR
ncbi:MAG: hypothetical protein WBQ94_05680 [Terracidiphilus sp.]